jgi:integrase
MEEPMPRPRPKHLHREVTRHGKIVWFVRVGKGPRMRIRGGYGTPEFDEAYHTALSGKPPQRGKAATGSLHWLFDRYRDSGAWALLSNATKRQRENIMRHVLGASRDVLAKSIMRQHIVAGIERRSKTPSQARNFLDAMRGLFEWAVGAEFVSADPTAGVKAPPRPRTDGFVAWTEEHVAAYQARWPLGTRQRVWLDVLLYSGLRRGDAVRYGRQHIRNGVGRIKTEKSGFTVTAIVPVLPVLQRTLDVGPVGDLTFIVGANGKPLTKESSATSFASPATRQACRARRTA